MTEIESDVVDEVTDEEMAELSAEIAEERAVSVSSAGSQLTWDELKLRLAERVKADHDDLKLREAVALRLEADEAFVTAAVVRRIGVRGVVAAGIFVAEGDRSYDGMWLETYADERWGDDDALARLAINLISCPCCYVFEDCHDSIGPFPCDPAEYRAQIAAEAEAVKAKYAVGARIGGYVSYAKHGDFVVTRSVIAEKKPSWCKVTDSRRWDIDFATRPGYDVAGIPQERRAEYRGDPQLSVWFEFRRAEMPGEQLGLLG